jgi:ribosomal protein S27AE
MVSLSVADKFLLEVHGTCPICGPGAHFVADNAWLRDHFLCTRCGSIPRERALMAAIQMFRPEWRSLTIHESSPAFRGPSLLFKQQAPGYSHSYFDETRPLGTILPEIGGRNENIEAMTFAEHSFDMFITQDVFEHIFGPHASDPRDQPRAETERYLHHDRAAGEPSRVIVPAGRAKGQ